MTAALPWIPGALRSLLLADPMFSASCGGYCASRPPGAISGPFAQLRMAGNYNLDGQNIGWKPLVQLDGWAPADLSSQDPVLATWKIASEAARVLAKAANVSWQTIHYTASVVDGPMEGSADTSRGPASPLIRHLVRAELTVHNH